MIVHKLAANAPFTADQDQDLIIEVLSVETAADPAHPEKDQVAPDFAERPVIVP